MPFLSPNNSVKALKAQRTSLQLLESGTLSPHLSVSVPVLSSPEDPLLPAGLPVHLTPLLLHLTFSFADQCVPYKLYLLSKLYLLQDGPKAGILRDFSEHGQLGEFCATTGKILTNNVVLVYHSNICVKQLLTG